MTVMTVVPASVPVLALTERLTVGRGEMLPEESVVKSTTVESLAVKLLAVLRVLIVCK